MLITIFSFFIILSIAYQMFKVSKGLTLFFFILAPIIVTPLWMTYESLDWFKWVKAYSLAITVVAITLTKYEKFHSSKKLFNFIYAFLGINIIEALIKDLATLDFVSAINIFIGAILVISLIDHDNKVHVDTNSKSKDFITPKLDRNWIVVYTFWNWVYVYSQYPEFALKHIAVLSVPLLMELLNRGSWLQARAITLGFHVIVSLTVNPYLDQYIPRLNPSYVLLPRLIVLINLSFLAYSLAPNYKNNYLNIYSKGKEKVAVVFSIMNSILK